MTKGILIDVNVTPDKRQVFLEQEKLLFAVIKYSLLEVLKFFPSTFKMQNLNITKNCASPKNQGQGIKRRLSDSVLKKGSILEAFKKRTKTEISCQDSTNTLESKNFNINEDKTLPAKLIKNDILNDNTLQSKVKKYINSKNSDLLACQTYDILESNNVSIPKLLDVNKKYNSKDDLDKSSDKEGLEESKWINNINCFLNQSKDASVNDNDDLSMEIKIDCPAPKNNKKTICLNFSIRNIKYRIKQMQEKNETSKDIKVKFRSDVIPEDNTKAEDELNKHIKKEDFMKMKIIGQFNLGFIISLLDNDLFIIDQHATDEKYNFEQLISTSVIRNQKLIR
ncbi:unnamed protein product [Brassicogethes aeneus]|uniref:MutL C-terminal dimerisation domain-containing protein n=1 Tax=Brassicogethes aeneus TaxID=1431903 RepID=A0A9P0ARF5_BRAAE|nr:unnamed protein product [Brassicogethes aeneus]